MRRYREFDIPTVEDFDTPRFRKLGGDTISCVNDNGMCILIYHTYEIDMDLPVEEINRIIYEEAVGLINRSSMLQERRRNDIL